MRFQTYRHLSLAALVTMFAMLGAPASADTLFQQNNLVSDLPGVAAHMDSNLVNPWGIDWGPQTPFWVSDNKTGMSTLYDGAGNARPLVVAIPPPSGGTPPGAPTGVVYSGGTHFAPDSTGARPLFLFAGEDGTVSGWAPGSTSAVRRADNSPSGAVYKGLALSNTSTDSTLYTTNFNRGTVDMFDANFVRLDNTGKFTDPNLQAGFAPFNIENIGDKLYVTYAKQDADKHDDVAGPGNGFIDVYSTGGSLMTRLVTQDHLNSPWGMAIAPAGFGQFAGDLLVGNFGDGTISAFNATTGAFLGQLKDKDGHVISIPGLWGLKFGNGGNAGDANTLFFTAGIPGTGSIEDHGLFGSLTVVPEPEAMLFVIVGMTLIGALRLRRRLPS